MSIMSNPKHVAIILDGNRRFAKRILAKPWEGHEFGAKKVDKMLRWCSELDIKEVTLFAFSVDNFNRPKTEFNFLMKVFRDSFETLKKNKEIHEKKIQINFLGRLEMFPEYLVSTMKEIMQATKNYDSFIVNFCMAYGGREEIADAARKMASDLASKKIKPEAVNPTTFSNYLYMNSEPDIIIRTGGEKRLSGFLLYQSSYSELFFLEKTWPEFEKEDLQNCVEEFKQRERRFGS